RELWRPIALGTENVAAYVAGGTQRVNFNQKVEDRFGLAASNGGHAVRRNRLYGFSVLVIHLELFLRIHGVHHLAAYDDSLVVQQLTQGFPNLGSLGNPFGNYMSRTLKSLADGRDLLGFVDKGRCELQQGALGLLLRPQIF